jgi:hypothetical protein
MTDFFNPQDPPQPAYHAKRTYVDRFIDKKHTGLYLGYRFR